MNYNLSVFFLLIFSSIYSQKEIIYEDVLSDIKNSQDILCIDLLIPNEEFSIGIYTNQWEVEDLSEEQCGDIKTDSNKNAKILDFLQSQNLLKEPYFNDENNKYLNLNSEDIFEWDKMELIIKLNFYLEGDHRLDQVYIPINDKKHAKTIIKSISKIFDSDYCFRKLRRKL